MNLLKTSIRSVMFLNILALWIFSAQASDDAMEQGPENFLARVRRPPVSETWAQMTGEAVHRRSGKDIRESPIYLGIRFTPERTLAQVFLNSDEKYIIGQKYGSDATGTSIIDESSTKEPLLKEFGLRPEDLTLSFVYWDLVKEEDREAVKGQECRVFTLKSPEHGESVKVYISTEYYFPMKGEWIRKDEDKPYRTVEVSSFKKEKDFWVVDGFTIYGPGWKTKVDFSKTDAGHSKDGVPENLFRKE